MKRFFRPTCEVPRVWRGRTGTLRLHAGDQEERAARPRGGGRAWTGIPGGWLRWLWTHWAARGWRWRRARPPWPCTTTAPPPRRATHWPRAAQGRKWGKEAMKRENSFPQKRAWSFFFFFLPFSLDAFLESDFPFITFRSHLARLSRGTFWTTPVSQYSSGLS